MLLPSGSSISDFRDVVAEAMALFVSTEVKYSLANVAPKLVPSGFSMSVFKAVVAVAIADSVSTFVK